MRIITYFMVAFTRKSRHYIYTYTKYEPPLWYISRNSTDIWK